MIMARCSRAKSWPVSEVHCQVQAPWDSVSPGPGPGRAGRARSEIFKLSLGRAGGGPGRPCRWATGPAMPSLIIPDLCPGPSLASRWRRARPGHGAVTFRLVPGHLSGASEDHPGPPGRRRAARPIERAGSRAGTDHKPRSEELCSHDSRVTLRLTES